uniref:NADH-ubiquinone oxidoreductase chain 6 n=1 Tax=Latoia hilarata TaxID=2992015 RepID=A0A9E7V5Y3_9NEOP|nr:NADH dehydrogenase subunit 6 [Latoia hilarata]UYX62234.1 NADH dehydrogenase subunit 6 [Latoia hilarata]
MKLFISMMLTLFSFLMLFINHPLSMGFLILMQTLLLAIMLGFIVETYWFSYILFLVFLGGLLVLFIYVSSIASNEMFKFKNNMKLYFLLLFSLLIMFLFFNNKNNYWLNLLQNFEIFNFNNLFMFNNENTFNLNKLYNNHTFFIMMILIMYLFITLITVVTITNIFYGPLRSNF